MRWADRRWHARVSLGVLHVQPPVRRGGCVALVNVRGDRDAAATTGEADILAPWAAGGGVLWEASLVLLLSPRWDSERRCRGHPGGHAGGGGSGVLGWCDGALKCTRAAHADGVQQESDLGVLHPELPCVRRRAQRLSSRRGRGTVPADGCSLPPWTGGSPVAAARVRWAHHAKREEGGGEEHEGVLERGGRRSEVEDEAAPRWLGVSPLLATRRGETRWRGSA